MCCEDICLGPEQIEWGKTESGKSRYAIFTIWGCNGVVRLVILRLVRCHISTGLYFQMTIIKICDWKIYIHILDALDGAKQSLGSRDTQVWPEEVVEAVRRDFDDVILCHNGSQTGTGLF